MVEIDPQYEENITRETRAVLRALDRHKIDILTSVNSRIDGLSHDLAKVVIRQEKMEEWQMLKDRDYAVMFERLFGSGGHSERIEEIESVLSPLAIESKVSLRSWSRIGSLLAVAITAASLTTLLPPVIRWFTKLLAP